MREIKFRAWCISNKKMINNKTCQQCGGYEVFYSEDIIPMQYTGLKDRNGNEIWEGDIVKFDGLSKRLNGEITFIDETASFVMKDKWGHNRTLDYSRNVEVIGNIYESPELLEKSE